MTTPNKKRGGWSNPASATNGAKGGSPPNIASRLTALEAAITAQERRQARRPLRYAEAEALRARLDAAHERMERLTVAAPDYPEAD